MKGEQELRKAYLFHTKHTLYSYAASRFVQWSFIPPHSPHYDGVWERLIGVIKRVLRAIIPKTSRLTDEILCTLFSEIQSIFNSRPLTKLSDDPNDLTPLTPNSLLTLKQHVDVPPSVGSASDAYRCRWKYVQHLANLFWSRWVKEYLPKLNARSKWTVPHKNMKVGELVLVHETGLPRNLWPLAIIKKVCTGRDGNVRSAIVKTRVTELHRPITQLIRLEVDSEM